ncbi:G-protein coupled receptor GRL101-like [Styela clava]
MSDEVNCSAKTHFYCKNENSDLKFIDISQTCDGFDDCYGGVDEIACRSECTDSVFASEFNMIKENAFVVAAGLINLLVGIYTTAIFVQNFQMSGRYCLEDQEWRSGSTCSLLGAILVIGSQASVFTLTILTGFRVVSIVKTFYDISVKMILSLILFSWTAAITLACIPLVPYFEDYFIESVTFDTNPLFATVRRGDVETLNKWLLTAMVDDGNDTLDIKSWKTLELLTSKLDRNFTIIEKFGYYSTHSVCLPKFFPDRFADSSWGYSLLFLLLNFCSFFLIVPAYILIYRKSNKQTMAVDEENRSKRAKSMQKKISFIVGTDFCCWMPVCIMGFLQVAGL